MIGLVINVLIVGQYPSQSLKTGYALQCHITLVIIVSRDKRMTYKLYCAPVAPLS